MVTDNMLFDRVRAVRWVGAVGAVVLALTACACLTLNASAAAAKGAPPRLSGLSAPGTGYPPIGAAVDTAAPHAGGGYEITIGGNCVPNLAGCQIQHFPYGTKAVQLLVLNRRTLAVVTDVALSGSQADAATAQALAKQYAGGGDLVILGDLPGQSVSSGYETAMFTITGVAGAQALNLGGGFAGIGIPQSPVKAGVTSGVVNQGFANLEPGHLLGDVRGYLQQSPISGNFSFVSGAYVSYNTHAGGSNGNVDVIRVGATRYTGTLPHPRSCNGGYAFVILNGATLQLISQTAIATNCASETQDQAGWNAVENELALGAAVQYGSRLVFMQNIGNPANPGSPGTPGLAAQSNLWIRGLGGSAEVFNRAVHVGNIARQPANSAYALVGSDAIQRDSAYEPQAYAPVAATVLTGQPARLQGSLRRDSDYNFIPATGASVNHSVPPSLATIVWQKPTPWLTGNTAGELKVLSFISAGMPLPGGATRYTPLVASPASCYQPVVPDVRFDYCDTSANTTYGAVSANLISHATPPSGCNCASADWTAVRNDLRNELTARGTVLSYLTSLFYVYNSGARQRAIAALQSITQQIVNAVEVSNTALVTGGRWDSLGADTFNVLSALSYSNPDIGTISNALNDISALGYLLGDIFGFSQSGNSLAAKVKTTAGQLGTQLKTLYANDQIALGRAAGIILTDYGKLTAAGSSPSFQTSLSELSTVGPEITIGASRFIYNHLLPAAYRPYAVLQTGNNPPYFNHRGQPSVTNTPASYICMSGGNPRVSNTLWSNAPARGWTVLSHWDGPDPLGLAPALGVVLSGPPPEGGHARTPTASIMKAVTAPIKLNSSGTNTGGLGENFLDLVFHNFHQYAIACHYYSRTKYGPSVFPWP